MNRIVLKKQVRIKKIRAYLEVVKKAGEEIEKEKVISWLIIEECISRKLAKEEIEAVMSYDAK